MKHSEDAEQKVLFQWASYIPQCKWMFAIPNGGNRNALEAKRLKAGGVKAGVSDIFLPWAVDPYCGLFIEMKRRKVDGRSVVSANQFQFGMDMMSAGYRFEVCYGAEEAIDVIKEYLML